MSPSSRVRAGLAVTRSPDVGDHDPGSSTLSGSIAGGSGSGAHGPTAEPTIEQAPIAAEPASSLGDYDDATLALRARDSDMAAFEVLIDRYQGPIFRLAQRMLGDRGEAEDVTQETLLTGWRRLEQLRHPEQFGSWLYRVATRRCIDLIRQRQRASVRSLDTEQATPMLVAEAMRSVSEPESQVVGNAQWQALAALVRDLPSRQRACWLLRELDGFGYAEIAGIVGMTNAGVRGQLARARVALAGGMAQWR